jgi:hypothetical protein
MLTTTFRYCCLLACCLLIAQSSQLYAQRNTFHKKVAPSIRDHRTTMPTVEPTQTMPLPPSTTPPPAQASIANPVSEAELNLLKERISQIDEQLKNTTTTIPYFLATGGLFSHEAAATIVDIKAIDQSAYVKLTNELRLIEVVLSMPTFDKPAQQQIITISRSIKQTLSDTSKVTVAQYSASISHHFRSLRIAALDAQNQTLPNVQFYIMSIDQFNNHAQFACNYYICDPLVLQTYAELNKTDPVFSNFAYYHVFAIQQRNGIDSIIGYELLPPQIEFLTIKAID